MRLSLAALDVMCVVVVSLPLGVLDENETRDLAAVSTSGNSLAEDLVLETRRQDKLANEHALTSRCLHVCSD